MWVCQCGISNSTDLSSFVSAKIVICGVYRYGIPHFQTYHDIPIYTHMNFFDDV